MPPRVVGIGGPTASGKSTVADALFLLLPRAQIVRQDAFYLPEAELPRHPVFETNWDIPESFRNSDIVAEIVRLRAEAGSWARQRVDDPTLNVDSGRDSAIETAAAKLRQSHGIFLERMQEHDWIIVEGICLYSPRSGIADHLDVRIFLTAHEKVLRQRREARSGYQTADGFVFVDPPGYWEGLVWPAYLETNAFLNDPKEKSRLRLVEHDSGENSLDEILASVVEHLHGLVEWG